MSRRTPGTTGVTPRQLRVGEALRHALAGVLMRGDFRDPDLAGLSITVTEVRVSPDLKTATAFVMPLGGDDRDLVLPALKRAASHLQGRIGRQSQMKFTPRLRFRLDDSFDTATRIDALLRDPHVARDLGPGGTDGMGPCDRGPGDIGPGDIGAGDDRAGDDRAGGDRAAGSEERHGP